MLGISPAHSDPAIAVSAAPPPEGLELSRENEMAAPGSGVTGPLGASARSLVLPDMGNGVTGPLGKSRIAAPSSPQPTTPALKTAPPRQFTPPEDFTPQPKLLEFPDSAPDVAFASFPSPSFPTTANVPAPPVPGAVGSPPMPINPHQANFERMTAPPLPSSDPNAHTALDTGRPGYEQIHNPWLRGLATVGDVVASGLFPRFGQFIPGTSGYHNRLVANEKGALGEEQAGAKSAADVAEQNARTAQSEATTAGLPAEQKLREAEARNYISEAEARANPALKQITEPVIDPNDPTHTPRVGYFDEHNPSKITYGPAIGAKPTDKTPTNEMEKFFSDNSKATSDDWEKFKTDHLAATKFTAEDSALIRAAGGDPGKPETLTLPVMKAYEDLKKEKPATVNVNAETTALDRESSHYAKAHDKAVSDANAQLDKIADARAMVNGSAEAQATGIPKVLTALVSGAGSGVRITQSELNMIGKARGIGGDVQAFVQKLSSGKKLTPDQQKQLTDLLDDVHDRVIYKQGIAQEALDKINSGASRNEIIAADKDARKLLADYEGGTVKMKAPDGSVKQVPSTQAAHFKSLGAIQVP
jgi:hypothetical protein